MGVQVGRECKLYYNSATHATPTWVLVGRAVDVSMTGSKGEADQSSRSSSYKKTGAGLKDMTIEFGYRTKTGADTVWDIFTAMFFTDTTKQIFCANQLAATSGSEGLRAFCQCFGITDEQAMEDGQLSTITLKPTYAEESSAEVDPDWYVVT